MEELAPLRRLYLGPSIGYWLHGGGAPLHGQGDDILPRHVQLFKAFQRLRGEGVEVFNSESFPNDHFALAVSRVIGGETVKYANTTETEHPLIDLQREIVSVTRLDDHMPYMEMHIDPETRGLIEFTGRYGESRNCRVVVDFKGLRAGEPSDRSRRRGELTGYIIDDSHGWLSTPSPKRLSGGNTELFYQMGILSARAAIIQLDLEKRLGMEVPVVDYRTVS